VAFYGHATATTRDTLLVDILKLRAAGQWRKIITIHSRTTVGEGKYRLNLLQGVGNQ